MITDYRDFRWDAADRLVWHLESPVGVPDWFRDLPEVTQKDFEKVVDEIYEIWAKESYDFFDNFNNCYPTYK
jgi:hypothetical protein